MSPESDGITRAPPGAHEHLRAFIGNHHLTHRTFGFTTLQTVHRANFGSPPVRVTATESLRTLTECFRTLTSLFGSSPGLFGVHQNTFGRSPATTPLEPARPYSGLIGFVARPAEYARASALHSCVMTATGCLRTPTGTFGLHWISPRSDASYPKSPHCGDRVVTKTISFAGFSTEQCTLPDATVVNLTSTPGFGLSKDT